jgi:PAS domain S-box-containing protein
VDRTFVALSLGIYVVAIILWTVIVILYGRTYRIAKRSDPVVAVLAGVLMLDAFKSVVENVYFGLVWAGEYGVAFEAAGRWLSDPLPLLAPKLLNLAMATAILVVIVRRWLPRELRAHRRQQREEAALKEELEASLLATDDGTWDYDVQARTLWTSRRLDAQLGLEPGELEAKTASEWKSLVHPDDLPRVEELLRDLATGKRKTASCEVRVRTRDGAERNLLSRAVTQQDASGRTTRIVCSQSDVTEQRQTEAALAARERVESLGLLAGGVAHDFNNLLAAIRCSAALARRDAASPRAQAALADLDTAVDRAAQLTSRLLAYSGRGRLVLEDVDLVALARDMVRLLAPATPDGARVETSFDEGLPLVRGDAAQLQQIVMNLYTNAIDALGGRPGDVVVRTRRVVTDAPIPPAAVGEDPLPPGEYVVLEVEDTGSGMDDETRRRLFQPFFSRKGPSRGLGLSAMLGALRAHHAGLQIRTAPGEGATFTLLFPAVARAENLRAASDRPAPRLPPRRRRALLADDEATLRTLLARVLDEDGFAVATAPDGAVARRLLETASDAFDVVVLDVTMPHVTGDAILAWLRAHADERLRSLPVVLMSGYAETSAPADPRTTFLRKPFAPEELLRAMERFVPSGPSVVEAPDHLVHRERVA